MFNKANTNTVPLLRYWTSRYLLVLLSTHFILSLIMGFWLRSYSYEQMYQMLEFRAHQFINQTNGEMVKPQPPYPANKRKGPPHEEPFVFQIINREKNVDIVTDEKDRNIETLFSSQIPSNFTQVLNGEVVRDELTVNGQKWLRLGQPIYNGSEITKALYVSIPTKAPFSIIRKSYIYLAYLFIIVALAGWIVLYFLSRKLTRPLLTVADASEMIAKGHYDVTLPEQIKEKEIKQLVDSFSDMASQLKSLERLRTDLLAGVSHELRTPITSIKGMIQAVQKGVVTGQEAEEFLQISFEETNRLQSLVENLLDFSSFELGGTPLAQDKLEITCLVEGVIQQLKVVSEFSGVKFDNQIPEKDVFVKGDNARLRQIFLNLFNNSQQASASLIEIAIEDACEKVIINIADNGKGIAEETQPYIFERFYGNKSNTKKYGLGLGLTLSRMIARAHKGELVLLKSSPEGTVFSLILPKNNNNS